MWPNSEEFIKSLKKEGWFKALPKQDELGNHFLGWVKDQILPDFLTQISQKVDDLIEINPDLSEKEILERATRHMVDFLGALSASVRIYDPDTGQMLSSGSYPSEEEERETSIPLEGSVAGEVVKTRKVYMVPNIIEEDLYQDKQVIERKGAHSLMAVPLNITRFFPYERGTVGVIQIYYAEKDRTFTPLESQMAELMARRLSFVITRKKILSMHRVNEKKETIVQKIFLKLGTGEGVKMKEVFNRVIPELADIINIQSCALFSVSEDLEHVVLEAGFPESADYHGIGKRFAVRSEPAFELVLNMRDLAEDSPYEAVNQSYVLVIDPQRSKIVSEAMKIFAAERNINSILYVPLTAGEQISNFMTFDALDQRRGYLDEEIEIFLFLGRELVKAQRMERLDDILHDFKNPAIATAGFARRLKQLIHQGDFEGEDERIKKYVEILLKETSRLQEMALSIYQVGEKQLVNLTEVLRNRFEINREAINEQLRQNVTLQEGPFQDPIDIRCYPLHLERVLDNLLNNATNALPLSGGTLSIRTHGGGEWACAEITNTGRISEEERLRFLKGEGSGRGLYITHRIVRLLDGKIEVRVKRDTTTFVVRFPIQKDSA